MTQELLSVNEASQWASKFLGRMVTPSNITYLVQYAKIKRYNNGNGESVLDIFKDYKHLIATRETIRTICLNLAWKSVYV